MFKRILKILSYIPLDGRIRLFSLSGAVYNFFARSDRPVRHPHSRTFTLPYFDPLGSSAGYSAFHILGDHTW